MKKLSIKEDKVFMYTGHIDNFSHNLRGKYILVYAITNKDYKIIGKIIDDSCYKVVKAINKEEATIKDLTASDGVNTFTKYDSVYVLNEEEVSAWLL